MANSASNLEVEPALKRALTLITLDLEDAGDTLSIDVTIADDKYYVLSIGNKALWKGFATSSAHAVLKSGLEVVFGEAVRQILTIKETPAPEDGA